MTTAAITLTGLQDSAHKYQKEIATMPVIGAQDTLQYMTPRPGVYGKVTLGTMTGDFEMGPYKNTRKADAAIKLVPRTLETFLGNDAREFDPNEAWNTIYGQKFAMGESMENLDITKAVAFYAGKKYGKTLNLHLWDAKYSAVGDTTKDMFNGFDTIAAKEIEDGNIASVKGNYMDVAEKITAVNAVDILEDIYLHLDPVLQNEDTIMYLPKSIYMAYLRAYRGAYPGLIYNNEFKKMSLDVSLGKCTLVPLVSKEKSPYIQVAPKSNMIYGYGNGEFGKEMIDFKEDLWTTILKAAVIFGTQYKHIEKEQLFVAKYHTTQWE